MDKIVIFDWGGVIMHKYPVPGNDKESIIRTIKSFNSSLSDEEAWKVYTDTLYDENGVIISLLNDKESKIKWVERICKAGNFNTSVKEFSEKFSNEYLKAEYYKDLVDYIHSLKGKCRIGIFSDLIYPCYEALDKQVDLSSFDYVWLSYITHARKNEQRAFEIVENDFGSKENILFIDDTQINIDNATKRGWNTCQAFGYELSKIKESVEEFLNKDKTIKR